MEKKSFFFLFSTPTLTGQAAQSFAIACELKRRGHPILVATDTGRTGDFEGIISASGIERKTGLTLCTKSLPHKTVSDYFRLKRIIREVKPDFLVCSFSHDHTLSAFSCGGKESPKIVRFFHGNIRSDPFTRRVMKKTSSVFFFVPEYMEKFKTVYTDLADRLHCIPGPVNPDIFKPGEGGQEFRKKVGFKPGDVVIGMVAHFQESRGHKYLVEAFSKIAPLDDRLKLMFVNWGETKESVEALVDSLKLEDRVVFTSFVKDDFPSVYRAMDIFVQFEEGHDTSCRAVVEAMATSVPVVIARKGAMAGLIDEGVEGFFIDRKEDVDNLSVVLLSEARNEQSRKEMGRAAMRKAIERHSVEKVTDLFLEKII